MLFLNKDLGRTFLILNWVIQEDNNATIRFDFFKPFVEREMEWRLQFGMVVIFRFPRLNNKNELTIKLS